MPSLYLNKHRPHSAITSTRYDLSTKDYRIPQPSIYNKLKNNINQTFHIKQSTPYTDILQLTKNSQSYQNKIDRLCSKYCIKSTNKKQCLSSTNIDSQKIAKNFILRKSQQKQSLQRKNYLNQEIKYQANTVKLSSNKIKTQQFFKLTCENLKKVEKMHQQSKRNSQQQQHQIVTKRRRKSSKKHLSIYSPSDRSTTSKRSQKQKDFHPYIKYYQQSQRQAYDLIVSKNSLNISYCDGYPVLNNDVQQWQRYQKSVKGIYSGIRRMRYAHSAREMAKSGKGRAKNGWGIGDSECKMNDGDDDVNGFYIT